MVAHPQEGLTDRGLSQLLPVCQAMPTQQQLPFLFSSGKHQAAGKWARLGGAGKGKEPRIEGNDQKEQFEGCRDRLTPANWASAATNRRVPRCSTYRRPLGRRKSQYCGGKCAHFQYGGHLQPQLGNWGEKNQCLCSWGQRRGPQGLGQLLKGL